MNNKGFTMVELLVAMAIMGLLIIMAFPTIRAIQTNNTDTKYKEYGKAAISASKLYVNSYGEDIFDSEINNQYDTIPFEKLVSKDLLKDVNVSGSTCIDGSSVRVVKYNNDYDFCLNLHCKAGGKSVYDEVDKKGTCKDFNSKIKHVYYHYMNNTPYEFETFIGDDTYQLLDPARMGRFKFGDNQENFKGWTLDSNPKPTSTIYKKGTIYPGTINNDIHFYAYTEKWHYKINYKKNSDGTYSGSTESTTCTCGSDCTLRNNGFSRTGYHFAHWKKDSNTTFTMNENVKTKIGDSIKSDWEQVNLTGIFDINVCKVTYDANGGVFTRKNHIEVNPHIKTDVQTVNYGGYFGGEGTMRDAQGGYYKAIRTGYEINPSEAWKSNNKTYSEEKRYSALEICGTALNTGNVNTTLYVNWKPKKYTVKINGDYNIVNKIYLGKKSSTNKSLSDKYDYGTKITINADKKVYYKFEGWKNSSGKVIYSGLKSTITVTDDLDLTASGRLSKIYVVYHYNGGKLKPGPYQKCTLIAGCKKNECYYKGDDYPKQLSGCTRDECADKTCYKTPGEDNYGYDKSWATEGLRNYAEKDNATIYITKKVDNQKYKATGKWHVGSKSGGTISEGHIFNDSHNTGLELLRLCDKKHKSGKYEETLKNNDVTVHLYAGWKKA